MAQQNGTGIKLFFEKVYLHVDRNYYASGDDIWFKAYLVNAQSNYPFGTSNNLYAELINPVNTIVKREVIRLDNGIGVGDFKLDDSIAGGSYRIRAYTNWMRNFGNHFIFEKEIEVKNIPGVNKKNSIIETASSENKIISKSLYKIQFFPEGGSLVEGISSPIAFKAEDAAGNGTDAIGVVISSKGDTVVHFKTSHLGMGSFNFMPEAGTQYKAWVQYKNSSLSVADFPVASHDGYVLKVTDIDTSGFQVNIVSTAATQAMHPSGEITIAAKHGGKICYREKFILNNKDASVTISKKDFPAGISSITLYDENLKPYCERLIYIQDKNPVLINITTDKPVYEAKGKVTVNVEVTDVQQHPVKANLSMAVTDDGIEKAAAENIQTYLLLQSEVNGKIENAAAYFDEKNPQRFQQLDLLLRTQGWRSFLWRQIADTNITLTYLPEQGITISGRVKQLFSKNPLSDMNITLQAPGAKGNKWYMTKTDEQGNYFLDGLPLYGAQTIKINSKNDKSKKGGEILMDTLFGNPLPVAKNFPPSFDTSSFRQFAQEAGKRYKIEKENRWYHVLPGVTVTTQKKTVILRDAAYMNFGYPEDNFTITGDDYKYESLRDFLAKKVPGAYYDADNDGVAFVASGKRIRPRFIVDKTEDVFERIDYYSVPMSQVISVSVKHLVGPPTFERTATEDGSIRDLGVGATDIFLIYLELKPGAYNQDPGKIVTEVAGYYQARIFYSPNYENEATEKTKPDERTTIHWEPLITTDENGKASVSFFNADPKTKIRIEVQGLTDKGVPVAAAIKYEVK